MTKFSFSLTLKNMIESKDGKEFNILGTKIKISNSALQSDSAVEAIDYVLKEAQNLRSKNPNLKDHDLAVLLSLEIAAHYLAFRKEHKDDVLLLKEEVLKAKSLIWELQ